MNNHIDLLFNYFSEFANVCMKNNYLDKINRKSISIDFSSKSRKGDVSSNFYLVAIKKVLDKKFNLKDELLKGIHNLSFIDRCEISKNGFININIKKKFLVDQIEYLLTQQNQFGKSNLGNGKNVNVEFVSANPTGPITVAHMRGAVLGDVISSLLFNTGHNVTREYYVNNAGSQIDILGKSLFKRYLELHGEKIKLRSNEYPGEYLIDIAKLIKKNDEDKWLHHDSSQREFYFKDFAVKYLIKFIEQDLMLLNIKFDKFSFETDIVSSNIINDLFKILDKKNLLYNGVLEKPKGDDSDEWEPREQLLFKSSKILDDQDRAFKKSNGEWTYFANDAAYHLDKYNRNYDQLINIWGADHVGYIPRMKSVLKTISSKDDYLEIVTCQIVRLIKNNEILKMSKREGNFITLKEVYNQVGKDPLRYFMVSTKSETSMDFDLNKVIEKNKDNQVFYCQYAYARASSVINKANNLGINITSFNDFSEIINYLSDDEIEIILKLLSYPYILKLASIAREPHRLTNFIEDVSTSFHSFWNKGKENESLRFIDEKNIIKTQTKLILLQSMRIVFENVFNIIGIDYHETM
jgi:arginyl-tRNA synthetase